MNKATIAIVLNGPPRIGKDTIGRLLVDVLPGDVNLLSFKGALYTETLKRVIPDFRVFVPPEWWGSAEYDETKDDPDFKLVLTDGFSGTVRECLIHVSERICKPKYGDEFFGEQLAKQLKPGYNVVTDGGFGPELFPLVEVSDRVNVVRLHRSGYNFDSDSRRYIGSGACPDAWFKRYHIENGESPETSARNVGALCV
jgi:hypothetical protein